MTNETNSTAYWNCKRSKVSLRSHCFTDALHVHYCWLILIKYIYYPCNNVPECMSYPVVYWTGALLNNKKEKLWHLESWCTIYSYLEISLKPSVFGCLTNAIAPSADCARELFKPAKEWGSVPACTLKNFSCWGCGFFVSDVINEVVFGPFWLMLPGLGPNC